MKNAILENIVIEEIAAEGKSLFRHNGKVYFIKNVVPQDIVTVQIIKSKKDWGEANLLNITQKSPRRIKPFCEHFTICGGCKWQMLNYKEQVEFKHFEVLENFKRIGKINIDFPIEVIPAEQTQTYRNKLEFAFSNKTFLTQSELEDKNILTQSPALGFHTNQIFDKIIPIKKCFLMEDIHNQIRNTIFEFTQSKHYTFYDRRQHKGLLRNLVIKKSRTNEILVNMIFGEQENEKSLALMNFIVEQFPQIASLYYTINTKLNDTIYDLKPILHYGKKQISEKLGSFSFLIGPQSFFQTNSQQAEKLYTKVLEFSELDGTQNVLDLYCGVGSIGIFVSAYAQKVMGIEIIQDAIDDAKNNAKLNAVNNIEFVQGDLEKMAKQGFFNSFNFKPDVLIIDPPRAGLSAKLIPILLQIAPQKIIYVSCNSATQSRDLALLNEAYSIKKLAIVDMFPHTHHIETVAQLIKK